MNSSFACRTSVIRFGVFELDCRAGELRKSGVLLHLPPQPVKILSLLASQPGQVVTREDIRKQIWGDETFVDFERGLNQCVSQIRTALGDDADTPRYIETLPRRGYRLIGPVEAVTGPQAGRRNGVRTFVFSAPVVVAALGALLALNVGGFRDRLLHQGAALPKIESIAVLPLENLSRDPDQEYFADGITEELITDLGKISALRVISRTSVMHYKGTRKTLPEIARELNVDAVVEGTVQRSGNRVRITASLLYAPTDRHLWANSYESEMQDILVMRGEVAQAIANEIRIKVTPQERTRLARAHQVNPDAYECYLKGRYEWNKRTKQGLNKGLEYFQQAIRADPGYALAYSGVADTYSVLGDDAFQPGVEVYPKAKAAALKALDLDESLAEAHTSMGILLFQYDREHEAALKEYEAAIELDPNYANAHHWYAMSLACMGRSQEAIREVELARKLDPLSPRINANVVLVLYLGYQYDRAIAEASRALELEPDNPSVYHYLSLAYLQKRMPGEALESLEGTPDLAPQLLARAYTLNGNRKEALKILGKLTQKWQSTREDFSPYFTATAYVSLGDRDQAFAWLEKGLAEYNGQMSLLKVDPALDPLRSDPRFQELLRRMNFPQERVARTPDSEVWLSDSPPHWK
ncbi:MAG TPA: winged helix-turn-helix domain-containing protein [Terriglobia bacterium]|nr:winged helix-turn-helix domain-containing protein [Terriglobia bacterium]